ncbi:MAG TPA: hypothetical protein VNU48_12970, partial [Burkholderiaceae bacterium]|nr:hypothetical protein [Burkholderiaceae bacterium]
MATSHVRAEDHHMSAFARGVEPAARGAARYATRVTHAERVIDPASGITKGELVAYYARVAAPMLPHLKARPVALVRAP